MQTLSSWKSNKSGNQDKGILYNEATGNYAHWFVCSNENKRSIRWVILHSTYGWLHKNDMGLLSQETLEAFNCFRIFKKMVEKETYFKINTLILDNGGEFTSNELYNFC